MKPGEGGCPILKAIGFAQVSAVEGTLRPMAWR